MARSLGALASALLAPVVVAACASAFEPVIPIPIIYCDEDAGPACLAPSRCLTVAARRVCAPSCGRRLDGEACAPGRRCIRNFCVPPGTTPPNAACSADLECVDGFICSSITPLPGPATCVPICVGAHYDDTECPAGTICSGASACVLPCDAHDPAACPCAAVCFVCRQEECSPGGAPCGTGTTTCAPNQICDTSTQVCVDPVTALRLDPRPPGGACHTIPHGCPANAGL